MILAYIGGRILLGDLYNDILVIAGLSERDLYNGTAIVSGSSEAPEPSLLAAAIVGSPHVVVGTVVDIIAREFIAGM